MKNPFMYRILFLLFGIGLIPAFSFAQAPQAFKYQCKVRNVTGSSMNNAAITIKVTIHDGSPAGTAVYQETHSTVTNQFGLINLEIGNGTAVTGSFPAIAWNTGSKWIEIEADFGAGYLSMGTSQLLSVPYALNFTPGPPGAPGVTGPTGPPGLSGINGSTGAMGATGATGTIGAMGATGSTGTTGAAGTPGTNGTNGTNGINGTAGTPGAIGATGPTGSAGTNGINGTNGIDGINGATGATGAMGATGATGLNGLAGTPGTNGTNGIDGINGATGATGATGPTGAIGLNGLAGTNGTNGIAGMNGLPGLNGAPGLAGANGTNGIDGINGATGATGATGVTGAAGATGQITLFSMFYGLTSGVGNGVGTDYPATIPAKTVPGSGRVPFPRNGPAAGITRIDNTSFTLPGIGTYEITFSMHTTEPGQFQLELNGVDLPETVAANMNATAGGHLITGDFLVTTNGLNSILAVVNPTGNAVALTITPADGSEVHANAQTLTIKKIF